MKKGLPIGIEDFETVIANDCCCVDKTAFLKPVPTAGSRLTTFCPKSCPAGNPSAPHAADGLE